MPVYWKLLANGYLSSENFCMYNPMHSFVPSSPTHANTSVLLHTIRASCYFRSSMQLIQHSTAGITIPSNSCDQARGKNAAAACFYPNLATQKTQSQANTLGAPLKQIVTWTEEVPEEIVRD